MKKLKIIAFVILGLGMAGISYIYAVSHGILLLNNPSKSRYPIRGVDVSHYQGDIDWQVLAGQGIDFAYIKATEGSSHEDDRFKENWEKAGQTGLLIGAYHFFSFDSEGQSQLEHFVKVVPAFDGMLPPVVDFEFYGDKKAHPPNPGEVSGELAILLKGLEAEYGMVPVIYATEETWEMYLKGSFDDYPLWIRNVVRRPDTGDKKWLIWQYTNRERLKGYSGAETYIDMNVFNGNTDDWTAFLDAFQKGGL